MSYVSTYQAHLLDNLTAGQKAVITAIATFERNGKAWPSVKTLAKRASMGIRTVQRHLAALINLGYITRTYRQGHAAVTRLFIGETPAKLAGEGMPNWHPMNPVIPESVNQIPAAPPATPEPGTETANAAFVVSESEAQEQPEPAILSACECTDTTRTPATSDLEHSPITSISTNEAIYKPVEPSKEPEGTDPPTGTNQATQDPVIDTTQAEADQADPAMADPVAQAVAAFEEIPKCLREDWAIVRKNKRKTGHPVKSELVVLAQEAAKAGITVQDLVFLCVTRQWSYAKAEWITNLPAHVQPGTPTAPALWTQDQNHIPASPATVATWREKIAQMKKKWASEPLKAPRPMRH